MDTAVTRTRPGATSVHSAVLGAPESGGPQQRAVGDRSDACGADGWAHLAAVVDCHDREIVGYE